MVGCWLSTHEALGSMTSTEQQQQNNTVMIVSDLVGSYMLGEFLFNILSVYITLFSKIQYYIASTLL